jgi:hypothetical protein
MAFNGGREVVHCAIDGQQWDALDPGVRFVHGDGRWECVDEVACFDRRAAQGVPSDVLFTHEAIWGLRWAFGQMPPARPGK